MTTETNLFGDERPAQRPPLTTGSPMEQREQRVQRLLADVFGVRIIDVDRCDVLTFTAQLRRHGLMLVMDEAVIR